MSLTSDHSLHAIEHSLLDQLALGNGLEALPLPSLIERHERGETSPLSFAQQQFWLLHQIAPDSAAYQHLLSLHLPPTLDVEALQRAMDELLRRHEAWRTSFPLVDGTPVQRIHPPSSWYLPSTDLGLLVSGEQDAELQHLEDDLRRPFDLQEAPPVRAHLIGLGSAGYRLFVALHHILYDGYALFQVFLPELVQLYQAFSAGQPSPLPDLPIQYADYALWQRAALDDQALSTHLDYWQKQLAGMPASLQLPIDHPRAPVPSRRAAHTSFDLPASVQQRLQALSLQEGATLFMTLLSGFAVLLSRYSGQDDMVIGTPATGRKLEELERLLGVCINTLPLRLDLSGNPSFRALLRRVRKTTLAALDHDALPFERLVQALHPERMPGQNPLFQVMMTLEQASPPLLPGWSSDEQASLTEGAAVDLRLALEERATGLVGYVEYDEALFEAATITRLVHHWKTLLSAVCADPDAPIAAFPLMGEEEQHQLLVAWNTTARTFPKAPIHRLFETWVDRAPEAIALATSDKRLTYRELNTRANQVAHHLRKLGVGPNVRVGLCMERSFELVVAVLAILKVGGAYVPLDPTYPRDRLAFMLEDSQAPVLLTAQSCLSALPAQQCPILCLDSDWPLFAHEPGENLAEGATADDLAIVFYTSGSTGTPKGVEIQHVNIARLVCNVDYAPLDETQTLLHLSPISFDAASFELYAALLNGGRCVLYPDKYPTPEGIRHAIETHHITCVFLTTALFNAVIDEQPEALQQTWLVLTGGEAFSVAHLRRALAHLPSTQIINCYGPTENTTFTTWYPIPSTFDVTRRSVPIGKPIANTQVYVLDAHLNPTPIGVPGELYIGGDGLARGYLHRPELTAERFLPHPWGSPPARLYKTGDVVRWLPDGNIEFLGRVDDQVKIRGFRIEPGEVETALCRHEAVREALVLAADMLPGEKRLAAYLLPRQEGERPSAEALRAFLQGQLPPYMIPSSFVWLDAFPLTPIGKIDRRGLPAPVWNEPSKEQTFVAPETPAQQQVARFWREVLQVERVGMHDNFFALGGSSLLATRLIARLSNHLGKTVPISWLFQYPTIAEFVLALDQAFPAIPERTAQSRSSAGASASDTARDAGSSAFVTVETRSLLSLITSGVLPPVEAVALGYLTDSDLPSARREQMRAFFQGLPLLTSVLDTPYGRIGVITLPLDARELYTDPEQLVRLCVQARTLARAVGARVMSLTGLLPSATRFGQAILDGAPSDGEVRLTTGHATTTAAVLTNVMGLVREARRDVSQEQVAFLGLGSVGTAALRLLLATQPHPAALLLCDLYTKKAALQALQREVRDSLGFQGELHLLEANALSLPDMLYEATFLIGATNVGNVLDIARVRPGTPMIDDSGPHCYNPAHAIERFQAHQDILMTEGGALLSPSIIRETVYAPDAWLKGAEDVSPLLASWHPEHIMGCAFSGLLSAREPDLGPTIGPVSTEDAKRHLERLHTLGFQAAPLHIEGYRLPAELVAAFRDHYGRLETESIPERRITHVC